MQFNRKDVYTTQLAVATLIKPEKVLRLCDANQQITGQTTWIDDLAKGSALAQGEMSSQSNLEEAFEYLKRVEAHANTCSSDCPSQIATLLICFLEAKRGNYSEVLSVCDGVIEEDPEEIMAYYYRIGVSFQLAAEEVDPTKLQQIWKSAKKNFDRFKTLVSQIPDGRLYHIKAYRKLGEQDPEGVQERFKGIDDGILTQQILARPDENIANYNKPFVDYYPPELIVNEVEKWMGGIAGMASAMIDLNATLVAVLEMESEKNVFFRSSFRMHLKTTFAAMLEVQSEENVFFRSSFRIFRALNEIDAANSEIQADPISANEHLFTAAAWLAQLEEDLPEEIVELETNARESIEGAYRNSINRVLASAMQDL